MLFHRSQLRRWAAHVLLVWLFGLAVGVAHACLATAVETPGAQPPMAVAAGHAHPGHALSPAGLDSHGAVHPEPAAHTGHHAPPGQANCQDFCQKSAVSLPPLKMALDLLNAHAAAPVGFVSVLPVPAFQPEQTWLPRREGGLAPPPIPIAFLRLAL